MDLGEFSSDGLSPGPLTPTNCVNMSRVINSRRVLCSDLPVRILYVHLPNVSAPPSTTYVYTKLRLRPKSPSDTKVCITQKSIKSKCCYKIYC